MWTCATDWPLLSLPILWEVLRMQRTGANLQLSRPSFLWQKHTNKHATKAQTAVSNLGAGAHNIYLGHNEGQVPGPSPRGSRGPRSPAGFRLSKIAGAGQGLPALGDIPRQPTPRTSRPPSPVGSPVIVGAEMLALSQHRPVQI